MSRQDEKRSGNEPIAHARAAAVVTM